MTNNHSTERIIKAPTGNTLHCKNWVTEGAYRMLMNNLDPDVAEKPEDLVVYGGTGKAARNWESYHLIVKALEDLNSIWINTAENWSVEQANRCYNLIVDEIEHISENFETAKELVTVRKNYKY